MPNRTCALCDLVSSARHRPAEETSLAVHEITGADPPELEPVAVRGDVGKHGGENAGDRRGLVARRQGRGHPG